MPSKFKGEKKVNIANDQKQKKKQKGNIKYTHTNIFQLD